jgi:GDPmannose 4,6-dehydratase
MPTAFVTGITGQDGGYLTERLLADGWDVHGLIHVADSQIEQLSARSPRAALHAGDLADASRLDEIVATVMPDEIYNLGGLSSVARSWQEPVLTGQVTGLGAAGLLEAAWRLQERTGRPVRVLQASSAEIFGEPAQSPQTEMTPIRPRTPYGAAKAYAHHLVGVYRNRGLHACGGILYNHESPRRPDMFVTRKITKAVAAIAAGKQDKLVLGSLDVRRDWGWAPDYVDALIRALRHAEADDYIVATGEAHSVRDFVATAFTHAGIADWPAYVASDEAFIRPVDAAELVGDATRARTRLGWAPKVSFEELVAAMVDADLAAVTTPDSGEPT